MDIYPAQGCMRIYIEAMSPMPDTPSDNLYPDIYPDRGIRFWELGPKGTRLFHKLYLSEVTDC